jgi:TP901 family phage tail tape measure protein
MDTGLNIYIDARDSKVGAKEIATALKQIQEATDKTTRKTKKLQNATVTAFKRMKKAVFSLKGAFAALGITYVLGKAIKEFKEFETALVDMGKVTQRSLMELKQEVMELPTILGSSTALMRGYYQVISAGVKGASEQLNTLVAATKAATAAHVDQSAVIKGLTGVVDAYEGAVRDATEAADIMFTIERLGKTTVQELIPEIGILSTVSAAMNVQAYEMGGALAQITKFAGTTSEAATQYRAILTALIKPQQKMIDLFADYGDASKAIQDIGFEATMRRIAESVGDSEVALGDLFGRKEAIVGFLALTKGGFEGLTYNIDEMRDHAGVMNEAFEKWSHTFDGVSTRWKATIEKMFIKFGEKLAPNLEEAMNRFSDWVEQNEGDILKFLQSVATTLEGITIIATNLGGAFTWFANSWGDFWKMTGEPVWGTG